jgi:hypothetical protein
LLPLNARADCTQVYIECLSALQARQESFEQLRHLSPNTQLRKASDLMPFFHPTVKPVRTINITLDSRSDTASRIGDALAKSMAAVSVSHTHGEASGTYYYIKLPSTCEQKQRLSATDWKEDWYSGPVDSITYISTV